MRLSKKFSIIVPVYNAETYIEKCLTSIISQTYKNYEIIVIDGGSQDSTVRRIKKHLKYIAHFISEKDDGQSYAINKGFKLSSGDFISWLNADEQYLPNTLEKVATVFEKNNVELCYGNTMMKSEENGFCFEKKHVKISPFMYMLLFSQILPSDATFWTKNLHNRVGGQLNAKEYPCLTMDNEWFLKLAYESKKSFYLDEILSIRLDRLHASTNSASRAKLLSNKKKIYSDFFAAKKWPQWILKIFIMNFQKLLCNLSPRIITLKKNYKQLSCYNKYK